MLQSWRANCDVQLIIYDSDPLKPDIAEIARITDYIVSYSTKGNVTWKEENEQTKQLIMASDDVYGGIEDLRRVAKQVMNKSATKRLISKQEAMVLLSGLPLTMCTETVESVSINNSREIKKTPNAEATDKRFVSVYGRRKICLDMSLSEYFCCVKNHPRRLADGGKYIIPNFIGISGTACYPVSEAYARHTIVVYKPWTEYPTNRNWIAEFNDFIESKNCPKSCKMSYERVMQRHYNKLTHYEPTASAANHHSNAIPEEETNLLNLVGLPLTEEYDAERFILESIDRGIDYKWDEQPAVRKEPYMCYRNIPVSRTSILIAHHHNTHHPVTEKKLGSERHQS